MGVYLSGFLLGFAIINDLINVKRLLRIIEKA